MTGNLRGLQPNGGPLRIKGVAHQYYSEKWQRWITRSWPKGAGAATPGRLKARASFSQAVQAIKHAVAQDIGAAQEWSQNTPFLVRDMLMMAWYGTLIVAHDVDGYLWEAEAVAYKDIQTLLDSMGYVVGSIIARDGQDWVIVTPGDDGDILISRGAGALPEWQALSSMLDTIGATEGALLVRGASAWGLLDQGSEGEVLTSAGADAPPIWTALATIQEMLDAIGSDDGDLLVRSGGAWTVLASPNDATQFLSGSATPSYQSPATVGAGGYAYAQPQGSGLVASDAHACHGLAFIPCLTLSVFNLDVACTTVAGAQYAFAIYEIDSTGKILTLLIDSGNIASPGAVTRANISYVLASPVGLTKGHRYAITFRRTDGTDTTVVGIFGLNTSAVCYTSLPCDFWSTTQHTSFLTLAKKAPAVNDTFAIASGYYNFGIGFTAAP